MKGIRLLTQNNASSNSCTKLTKMSILSKSVLQLV